MSSIVRDSDQKKSDKPAKIGQYLVIRELGQGGMARVFEARHEELGNRVALKVLLTALAAQPQDAARFLREAKAASQIRHQHVVDVFDIGTQDGIPFIVMEFLDGSDLATLLAQKGAMPLSSIVDVFLPVISAVATAHRAGVIHRDLKPANLMITSRPPRGPHPMVLDFGISKILDEAMDNSITRSESLVGTVQYMAPELTRGAKFASVASDQYALGVMLYECATGMRPFGGGTSYETMHAIVTAPLKPPSQVVPSLPSEFDAVVLRAMEKDPAKRFPSVHALGNALLSFGDKAAWTLWEREFVENSAGERDLWSRSAPTLAGGDSMMTTFVERPVRGSRRGAALGKWIPWSLIPLTAYAAATTILLARRSEVGVSSATPGSGTIAAPPSPTSTERVAREAVVSDLVLNRAPPEPVASASRITTDDARGEPRRPAKSRTAPASSQARPAASTTTPPSVSFGANQAPIVD